MKKPQKPSLSLPASAEQWREYVSNLRLPILDATRKSLNRSGGGHGISAGKLAVIARFDPSLRLQLLSYINRAVSQYDSPALESGVRSVEHGATLVGVEQTLRFVRSLPVASGFADDQRLTGFTQALASAFVGGEVASSWMREAGRNYGDGMRLAAQYCPFIDALVWASAKSPAQALSSVLKADCSSSNGAEKSGLGLTYEELGDLLSKIWAMPPAAPSNAVYVRALKDVARAASVFVQVSAIEPGSNLLDAQLRAASKHLEVAPNKLRTIAYRCIARCANEFSDPTAVRAARNLLLGQSCKLLPDWYVEIAPETGTGPEVEETVPTVDTPSSNNVVQMPTPKVRGRTCEDILLEYQAKKIPVHTAMQQLVESAKRELKCKRVVLCMMNRDRSRVVGRFSSEAGEDVRSTFDFELDPDSLLSKLLDKQAGLMVSQDNHKKVISQLPSACASAFGERAFCLMSIFARSKAIGLMIAEFVDATPEACNYQTFKELCLSTSLAIERGVAA